MTTLDSNAALVADAPLDASALCGDWVTTDHAGTGGMRGLTVTEDAGGLWVRGLGLATPVAYAWDRVRAGRYAADPTSRHAWSLLAHYDFGFMQTVISVYCKLNIFIATTYNTFRGPSERTDYWTREFFHRRSSAAPPATTAAPPGISRSRDLRPPASRGSIDPAPMLGRWVNFDREARGITGVTVSRTARGLTARVDELGSTGVRAWPELTCLPMADTCGGGPAIGFLATGELFAPELGGPHRATLCAYLNRGLLTIDAHLVDQRQPAHVMVRTHLHLAEEATV